MKFCNEDLIMSIKERIKFQTLTVKLKREAKNKTIKVISWGIFLVVVLCSFSYCFLKIEMFLTNKEIYLYLASLFFLNTYFVFMLQRHIFYLRGVYEKFTKSFE